MSNNMQSLSGAKPANQSAIIEEVLDSLGAQVAKAGGLARVAGKAAGMVGASAVMGPWGMALPENEANNIYYLTTSHTHINQLIAADPFSQSYTYDLQNAIAQFAIDQVATSRHALCTSIETCMKTYDINLDLNRFGSIMDGTMADVESLTETVAEQFGSLMVWVVAHRQLV